VRPLQGSLAVYVQSVEGRKEEERTMPAQEKPPCPSDENRDLGRESLAFSKIDKD
jgi:hypothetical protein